MLLDASKLRDKSVLEADFCIIGAGPAGITLARELNKHRVRVCLVESGAARFASEAQQLSRLASADSDITPNPRYRRREFGGNAHMWGVGRHPVRSMVRYLPLDELDFARRDWVPSSGWPFGKADLDPFYERAHRTAGIGSYSYVVPESEKLHARLRLDDAQVRTSVEWFGTAQPFTRDALAVLRESENVSVLLRATAGTLEMNRAGDRIDRLRVDGPSGTSYTIAASSFVLAAGGIENARLLLLCNTGVLRDRAPVGRYFMDHLHVVGRLVPARRELLEQAALYDVRRIPDGRIMGCKLNLTDSVMHREQILNSALKIEARLQSRPLAQYLDTRTRLIVKHRQLMPSNYGWSTLPGLARRCAEFWTYLQIELPPREENRVTLSEERDRFGRPLAAVRWQWDDLTRRTVRRTREILTEHLHDAGIGTFTMPSEDPPPLPNREGINHHIGTTRMHPDPAQGVVDADCRVHGVANLFATGSSVFPTGGYANPTLTIVALAIRLADHLVAVSGK
jgi:choline dehydrogenase-like flavoprotein